MGILGITHLLLPSGRDPLPLNHALRYIHRYIACSMNARGGRQQYEGSFTLWGYGEQSALCFQAISQAAAMEEDDDAELDRTSDKAVETPGLSKPPLLRRREA
ncbi:conserved hypothetical protein [Ricinus communis]|uniref:Uncharacterized protein n=1 Tax=Ricinus communis TaxID=3988 RepID=B9SCH5_RICCO|nr:conserved hypothetical protein [Ricinus communis]